MTADDAQSVRPRLPIIEPTIVPETEPFWRAASEGRLALQRCDDCGAVIWYPRALCPECWSTDLSWFEASGLGRIYSCTVNRRPVGAYAAVEAYVLAYVEVDEGPRILTNIVTDDPPTVRIGQRVRAVFDRGEGAWAIVRFEVVPEGGSTDHP